MLKDCLTLKGRKEQMTLKEAVQEYQCPGCVDGIFPDCYEIEGDDLGCSNHCAGTMISNIGRIFLGMPKGFNRLGFCEKTVIYIFKSFNDLKSWNYNKFNIPVWKYLDKHGNTLIRGLSPRVNLSFIHIFLGNELNNIDCLEITQKDIEDMD